MPSVSLLGLFRRLLIFSAPCLWLCHQCTTCCLFTSVICSSLPFPVILHGNPRSSVHFHFLPFFVRGGRTLSLFVWRIRSSYTLCCCAPVQISSLKPCKLCCQGRSLPGPRQRSRSPRPNTSLLTFHCQIVPHLFFQNRHKEMPPYRLRSKQPHSWAGVVPGLWKLFSCSVSAAFSAIVASGTVLCCLCLPARTTDSLNLWSHVRRYRH